MNVMKVRRYTDGSVRLHHDASEGTTNFVRHSDFQQSLSEEFKKNSIPMTVVPTGGAFLSLTLNSGATVDMAKLLTAIDCAVTALDETYRTVFAKLDGYVVVNETFFARPLCLP